MYTNLMIDFGVGLIPLLGDFADAWFKCNTRNNVLLERYLRERGEKNPAPPPAPKQPTMQRWFGPGSNAPVVAAEGVKPDLPSRHEAPATKVSGLGSSDQDLEAQNNDEGVIHYRREE
jgi:hypothetical protein